MNRMSRRAAIIINVTSRFVAVNFVLFLPTPKKKQLKSQNQTEKSASSPAIGSPAASITIKHRPIQIELAFAILHRDCRGL